MLDDCIERLPAPISGDAVLLRARVDLKSDSSAALTTLSRFAGRLRSKQQRAASEMLQGVAYARLGDFARREQS
ncbi:MAG: hypothetical protein IAI50_10780 [Candidatus Eremiobacteraeota bacterium]|nr:hypothetical protein [Candidatus Eremiobacteraeota bacterium]